MSIAGLRRVEPLPLPDLVRAEIAAIRPSLREVDPKTLLVDESYQRSLSRTSIKLIRRIVAGWSWHRYKPPIVTETVEGIHVIDGQHTAIAAATHGGLATIPVMIIDAIEVPDRAKAFIGHNRDRINVTGLQMHFAALAAGDEEATTVEQVCQRAGVRILRFPSQNGMFSPGETLAIGAVASLVRMRGAMKARQVLQVLADAKCAPVSSDLIKAVDTLLCDREYASQVTADALTLLIRGRGADAENDARIFRLTHKLPHWRALTIALYRMVGKSRRVAA